MIETTVFKLFGIMYIDRKTRYEINSKKFERIDKLVSSIQLLITQNINNSMDGMKYHDKIFELNSFVKELLDTQCFLIQVSSLFFVKAINSATVSEIFDYCKANGFKTKNRLEKVILLAIFNGYLKEVID